MKIAVVMDPISNIDFKKDSTLLLIYEAQKRNHDVFYIESKNLFFEDGHLFFLHIFFFHESLHFQTLSNQKFLFSLILF